MSLECINCGDDVRVPGAKRCPSCYRALRFHQRLTRPVPHEPEPLTWAFCRFCGATGPRYPLRHGPGCPVKVR